MSRAEVCHCGHDQATHFEQKHTCLGMLCDCSLYVHRDDPAPPKPKPVPVAPHVDDSWDPSPVTHPIGCTCMFCRWNRP